MLHKHNEMKKLKYEMVRNEVNMNNNVKWNLFKMPVKVEQSNENLLSNTTKSNNIKEQGMAWGWIIAKWQWDEAMKPCRSIRRNPSKHILGRETKEEKISEKYEFWVFWERQKEKAKIQVN
jgi:hypothetical protein